MEVFDLVCNHFGATKIRIGDTIIVWTEDQNHAAYIWCIRSVLMQSVRLVVNIDNKDGLYCYASTDQYGW